jgi:hypothetical protein
MPWGERMFHSRNPLGSRICFVDEKTLFTGHPKAGNTPSEHPAGPAAPSGF